MSAKAATGNVLDLFKSFDEAIQADINQGAPSTVDEMLPRLKTMIDALPQRSVIQDHHAERWLSRTMEMTLNRMELEHGEGNFTVSDIHTHVMWHIRRASGIGGSEAGTVVKHFRGERGSFTTAHNLVMEKLLIMAPQNSTPEMARGVRAEPWVQKIYQAQTGAVTDQESLDLLRSFRWDKVPYLAGTPDDFVLKPEGGRRMVDYKAPSADVCADYERSGISFDYVCQLHHYGVLSMAAGVRFSDMSVEVHDPRYFQVVSFPVPLDPALAREIAKSANTLWKDYILQGIVPDAPKPDDLRADDPDLIAMGHEAAMFKVLKDAMEKREKDLLTRIATLGTIMHDKAVGKLAIGVADYTRARVWDEEKLISLAEASGVDLDAFRVAAKKPAFDADKGSEILSTLITEVQAGRDVSAYLQDLAESGLPVVKKLDTSALAKHLEEVGIDTIEAAEVAGKFALTRKSKGPEAEALERLRAEVENLAMGIDDVVAETAQSIILGEQQEENLPEM